jgi:hypothetical protein
VTVSDRGKQIKLDGGLQRSGALVGVQSLENNLG